ncbi:Phage head morphogenesis protein [Magnetospirillum sp. XM-1]|uniref:PBECR2 nuclease fold domain-containing protein n=1 Tax=Magnetospirillum sp. XM-1 TaxID=1663591 RepID=UPI00073DE70C|nr:PBECR2 nuclease fold domain-containing protein [Magnetospirillum sp. XM-1]CUW41132.1 Phage head morphogenesis protein [Magnetospirillum sp. XM-1]
MATPAPVDLRPLPPTEALRYLRSKGYKTGFAWQDVWQGEHARAFTVAKAMRLDILADIREALDKALADGTTFEQFKRELKPVLQAKGWWGRKEMADPATGEISKVQLGSPRRLAIIFDANIRTAHAAGDWAKIERVKADRPFLMYDAVLDRRTRPQHRSWSGTVLPVDDPWWDTHYTPNGWRCRCRVRQLGYRDLARYGLQVADKAPKIEMKPWFNQRTGKTEWVAEGIDPGWGYNVGKEHMRSLVPPPASGALPVPAINPPADTPMPAPRPFSPSRLLPGAGTPGALTEEGYVERFLAEFGAEKGPKVITDKIGDPVVIGRRLFQQADGSLKVTKRGREKTLLALADALKDPDEIWWQWEQNKKTGRWFLAKRYLARFDVDGKGTPALLSFSVGEDGWEGATAFSPTAANLANQRRGTLAYRRPAP